MIAEFMHNTLPLHHSDLKSKSPCHPVSGTTSITESLGWEMLTFQCLHMAKYIFLCKYCDKVRAFGLFQKIPRVNPETLICNKNYPNYVWNVWPEGRSCSLPKVHNIWSLVSGIVTATGDAEQSRVISGPKACSRVDIGLQQVWLTGASLINDI